MSKLLASKTMVIVWGLCIVCITLVITVSALLTIPTASVAEAQGELEPIVDPALLISTAIIPITFLLVILTRPKRGR